MLSEIVLTHTTEKEFKEMDKFWYPNSTDLYRYPDIEFLSILKPINYQDYTSLIRGFIEERYSDKISVNKNGKWLKYYKRKMKEQDINEIAEAAKTDSVKRGHLEFYFKKSAYDPRDIRIKFVEFEEKIISYKINFLGEHAVLFKWEGRYNLGKNKFSSLWVPNDVENMNWKNLA